MLSGKWSKPLRISAEGSGLFEHMLWTMALGDFTSIYLALLNGVDPTPVELIEKFKHALAN
jgi:glucose/mannose-6-phosphate isomerase